MTNIISTFFVILILILPLVLYVTSLSTVTTENEAWFDQGDFPKMPDLMYTRFGKLTGVIANAMFGAALLFLSKILVRSASVQNTRFENFIPSSIKGKEEQKKSVLEIIIFFAMPIMYLMYIIAYPVMCATKEYIAGALLNLLPGIYFLIFGAFLYKYSLLVTILVAGFGSFLIYTGIMLLLVKKNSSQSSDFYFSNLAKSAMNIMT